MKPRTAETLAQSFFKKELENMHEAERRVLDNLIERTAISQNINQEFHQRRTFGERVADRVASFGGSWTFICIFAGVLLGWVVLNSFILASRGGAFDPYPYILLNLFLSMLAAIQAPIIMMSQNRQAARDRMDAAHDYEVNLKAEIEVATLHDKIDELRETQWLELLEIQRKQIEMLEKLLKERRVN